jgi:hypothetical protein
MILLIFCFIVLCACHLIASIVYIFDWCSDSQLDMSNMSSGSGSPMSSMPASPGPISMPVSPGPSPMSPGVGLFGSSTHPHLKGDDECEDPIITTNEKNFQGIDVSELVEQLRDTDSLHEQADIIHYLFTTK